MGGVDTKSDVAICNLALGHLGISTEISNLTTERSAEAATCRRYFNLAREKLFREFPYPLSRKFATLSLVEENPNDEWDFSYRYPSDCLYFKKILSGVRNDTRSSRIPYLIASDDAGKLIFTDQQNAECEYTKIMNDPKLYMDDIILAFSYLLAGMMAPRLTHGDGVKLGDRAFQLYEDAKVSAENESESEQQEEELPDSEFIRARE